MKRTKDGGAILKQNGETVRLTKAEFLHGRLMRDLFRIGAVILIGIFDLFILRSSGILIIATIFLMIGWRLKLGW